jgi:hypothetical protein
MGQEAGAVPQTINTKTGGLLNKRMQPPKQPKEKPTHAILFTRMNTMPKETLRSFHISIRIMERLIHQPICMSGKTKK